MTLHLNSWRPLALLASPAIRLGLPHFALRAMSATSPDVVKLGPEFATFDDAKLAQMEAITGVLRGRSRDGLLVRPIITRLTETRYFHPGPPARALLKLSQLFEAVRTRPVRMLESAAGGGCLTAALFREVPSAEIKDLQVVCGDLVPEMVELAAARSKKEGWKNVDAKVFDGMVRWKRVSLCLMCGP